MLRGTGDGGFVDAGKGFGTLFGSEEVTGLDAALLIKRTGVLLAAWGRDSVDLDVLSVMTATLLGSVETIAQAMHGDIPQTLVIEAQGWRMVASRLESQAVLVLIAPMVMREAELRRRAQTLAGRLSNGSRTATLRVPEPSGVGPERVVVPVRSR